MSLKFKDLAFTAFYEAKDKITKKIQKIVFPNDVQIGVTTTNSASLEVLGSISASHYYGIPSGGGGGGGAPTDAQYIVATANGDLTAERVATNTTSVTWDFGTAGQAKANVPDATTSTKGVVELATSAETTAGLAVQASDTRLSDARTPTAHATSHQSGGSDPIKLDDLAAPDDNTDLNATTLAHGLLRKLSGNTSNFLRGDGNWATPPDTDTQNTLDQAYDEGGAGVGRLITVDAGAVQLQGLANTNTLEVTGNLDLASGYILSELGFSGSLTKLTNGASYLVAGPNITITSQSNGQVTVEATDTNTQNTLDQAYDEGGSGAGRTIAVDSGAVQLQGTLGTNALEGTGTIDFSNGTVKSAFTGSLTELLNGTPYIRKSGNISITTASNGSIILHHADWNLDKSADLLWTSSSVFLSESLRIGSGSGHAELYIDSSETETGVIYHMVTGAIKWAEGMNAQDNNFKYFNINNSDNPTQIDFNNQNWYFPAAATASLGFSGSLTRLADGRSYLVAGTNITITSESNGQVTIGTGGGDTSNTLDQAYDKGGAGAGRLITVDAGAVQLQGLANTNTLEVTGNLDLASGYISSGLGFSGSLTKLTDGSSYLVGGSNVLIASQSNGQITISATQNTLNGAYDEGLPGNGRLITVDAGAIQMQGSVGTNTLEVTGTIDNLGTIVSSLGFSGSLTNLSDGQSYLQTSENGISISSSSNGPIVLSSDISLYSSADTSPEGVITANPGAIWTRSTSVSNMYRKYSGFGSASGWRRVTPANQAFHASFSLTTSQAGTLVYIPLKGSVSESTAPTYWHQLLMPEGGYISNVYIRADQALDSSCDITLRRMVDGSTVISQVDSDTTVNLSTANTAVSINSILYTFSALDVIMFTFTSNTISTTTEVLFTFTVEFF